MVSKYNSVAMQHINRDFDKYNPEAINTSHVQKSINSIGSEQSIPSNRKGKDIPYKKLIMVAELLN